MRNEVLLLILMAFSIVLLLGNFGLTSVFGDVVNSFFFGIFGGMEFVFPFLLFLGTCFYLANRRNSKALVRLGAAVALFFQLGMFLQFLSTGEYSDGGFVSVYDYAQSTHRGGGFISGGLYEFLAGKIGTAGTVALMAVLFILCIVLLTGQSFLALLMAQGSRISDRAAESRAEWEKDREVSREMREVRRESRREERAFKREAVRSQKLSRAYAEKESRSRALLNLSVGNGEENPGEANGTPANGTPDNAASVYGTFGSSANGTPVSGASEKKVSGISVNGTPVYAETNPSGKSKAYSPFSMAPENRVKPPVLKKKDPETEDTSSSSADTSSASAEPSSASAKPASASAEPSSASAPEKPAFGASSVKPAFGAASSNQAASAQEKPAFGAAPAAFGPELSIFAQPGEPRPESSRLKSAFPGPETVYRKIGSGEEKQKGTALENTAETAVEAAGNASSDSSENTTANTTSNTAANVPGNTPAGTAGIQPSQGSGNTPAGTAGIRPSQGPDNTSAPDFGKQSSAPDSGRQSSGAPDNMSPETAAEEEDFYVYGLTGEEESFSHAPEKEPSASAVRVPLSHMPERRDMHEIILNESDYGESVINFTSKLIAEDEAARTASGKKQEAEKPSTTHSGYGKDEYFADGSGYGKAEYYADDSEYGEEEFFADEFDPDGADDLSDEFSPNRADDLSNEFGPGRTGDFSDRFDSDREDDFADEFDPDEEDDLSDASGYGEEDYFVDDSEFAEDMGSAAAAGTIPGRGRAATSAYGQEEEDLLPEEDNPEELPREYVLPGTELLKQGKAVTQESAQALQATADKIRTTLLSFGVRVRMLNAIQGPTVTRYEMQPEQGVKVNRILNLSDDIKLNLAATDIRIEAPIPGKAAVGIEVPNQVNATVMLRELLEDEAFRKAKSRLSFAVGKNIGGETVVFDIAKMPHLLIAGATGSGKSVCINTIIMSILYKAKPDEVKMIMIDPKVVELSVYNGLPHLMTPVVTDAQKAAGALKWGVAEMEKRYRIFERARVKNLQSYNEKVPTLNAAGNTLADGRPYEPMPQILIVVDELADLMMVAKSDVETAICRLAQLARAAGIHLIIATQRPSVDVITGLIKANMPSRIAFAVSSGVDSKTILDMVGAEKLLGKGDMLFYPQGYPRPERLQGAFLSDDEVQAVVNFILDQCEDDEGEKTDISSEIDAAIENSGGGNHGGREEEPKDERDQYFEDAGHFIIEKKKASIGMLQRVFKIGFNRAARIMDQLAEAGVVSGEDGTKARQILMTEDEFDSYLRSGGE